MVGSPLWGPRFVTRMEEEEEEEECYDNFDDVCITCICCCFCQFIIFGVFNLIKSAQTLLIIACSFLFICLLSLFVFGLFVYSFVLNIFLEWLCLGQC